MDISPEEYEADIDAIIAESPALIAGILEVAEGYRRDGNHARARHWHEAAEAIRESYLGSLKTRLWGSDITCYRPKHISKN